jgi:hypothetical protein
MNKITRIFVLSVLSTMAIPTLAFSHYTTSSNTGENPSNQQQAYSDRGLEDQYSNQSNHNYSQQQQHPVYEYMLGKDGKWHQTTDSDNHAHSQDGRNAEPSSPQNDGFSTSKGNNQR